MQVFRFVAILATLLLFSGCDQSDKTQPVRQSNAPTSQPANRPGVEVHAPNVDVKSNKEGTSVRTPGADVEVQKKQP
jgi:uncharacterized lipoprotein YajG